MRLCFCVLVFGLSAFADVITVGAPGDSISGDPFAAPLPGFVGTRYQQAYSSADFPGAMAITSISFFDDSPFEGPLPVAKCQIFLSTITPGIDALSGTNFDSNDGPDNTLFASVDLSGPAPLQLVFAGVVRIHRMIRRGTSYGPLLPEGVLEDDGVDRGLMFAFVGAHLGRQFEFIQSEWMNDSAFFGGSPGKDPISGAADGRGTFDIPKRPLRQRLQGLPRFVVTRGGEYCFMPGLRALDWLGNLTT